MLVTRLLYYIQVSWSVLLLCILVQVTYIVLHFIGIVPHTWMKYTIPPGMTVLQWVTDFSKRIEQLQRLSSAVSKNGAKVVRVSELHHYHTLYPLTYTEIWHTLGCPL